MTRDPFTVKLPNLLSLCLVVCIAAGSVQASALQKPKPGQEQESAMLGLLLSATQDLSGGRHREARSKYEQILRELETYEYPRGLRWKAYDGYGLALLATGEPKLAFDMLNRALQESQALNSNETIESMLHIGLAFESTGNLAEAIKQYKLALGIESKNPDVMLALGSAYRRNGQFKEARETYEKLISKDPRNANAYKNLGNVYLDQGENEKAVGFFEKFAANSSDKVDAAKNFLVVGFRYYNKNQYEKALALYRRAVELTPDNPLAHADIGWAKLGLGQTAEAIQAFEKALRLNPPEEVAEFARKGLDEARQKK